MNPDNIIALRNLKNSFSFSDTVYQMLCHYTQMIEDWNLRTNLISDGDISRIVHKHIQDSLDFCSIDVFPESGMLIDIGSGAGFPGIPIKIFKPALQVFLIESKRMKYLFLCEVIEKLQLQNITALCSRVENISSEKIFADIIVARAVKPLITLWEWCLPILTDQGFLIAQKGGDINDEIAELQKYHKVKIKIYSMDKSNMRKLITIAKPEI
jgi:16S rRNA (guanine527-N7)-methyltransferase